MAEIIGTLFQVHGDWFLRHEGGGGSLIRIQADKRIVARLVDGKLAKVDGYISTDGMGCAQQVVAKDIVTIG